MESNICRCMTKSLLISRCTCGHCSTQPTVIESHCCREVDEVKTKVGEWSDRLRCITEHEGFDPVCLNVHVLQTAYYEYRQRWGQYEENDNLKWVRAWSSILIYKTFLSHSQASKFQIECTCPPGKWIVKITCPNVPFTCLKYTKPMQLMWKSVLRSRP